MMQSKTNRRTYRITTLGCKVNQCESDAVARDLKASGWTPAAEEGVAALHIVNTCAVTGKASMQSRQAVRQAIRSSPGAQIVVTGCSAQVEIDDFKKIKGVNLIVGHAGKHRICNLIASGDHAGDSFPLIVSEDIGRITDFAPISPPEPENRTRPFLKIQDGCDASCTYCIVPHARGRSRSMPPDTVLGHLDRLKQAGYREVVISGIHLGSYGLDLRPETDLCTLLERIHEAGPVDRVRLSSIEPNELSQSIIDLVSGSGCLCRHFHIPLQSGDDLILKRMNRPYTKDDFRNLVRRILRSIPDAAIGVDTLIGFPGETEAAFENTRSLIGKLPVTYLHVFPFSARIGTPAARYPDTVPHGVVKERAQKMRALGDAKKKAFYGRFPGKTLDVLIESTRDPSTGCLKGFSSNLIPVFITGRKGIINDDLKNTIVRARIEELYGTKGVFGSVCR
jgi:threonylcarbamoyladenosine tRNA methylthiotransferase MtaB